MEYIRGFHPISVFRILFTCPVPSCRYFFMPYREEGAYRTGAEDGFDRCSGVRSKGQGRCLLARRCSRRIDLRAFDSNNGSSGLRYSGALILAKSERRALATMAKVSAKWGPDCIPRSGGSRGSAPVLHPHPGDLIQAGQTRCRPTDHGQGMPHRGASWCWRWWCSSSADWSSPSCWRRRCSTSIPLTGSPEKSHRESRSSSSLRIARNTTRERCDPGRDSWSRRAPSADRPPPMPTASFPTGERLADDLLHPARNG